MHLARLPLLTLLAALLCSVPATATHTTAIVTTSDWSTGQVSVVDLDTRAATNGLASVHSDTFLRWHDQRIYVGNRFGQDNIQVISPSAGYATVRQYSVGNGSNPADIAYVSPNKSYVTRYEESALWIVDSLGTMTGSISLAAWADADGVPEMAAMYRIESRVFVAVQRLDRNDNFAPTDTSYVVVVDADADTVLKSIRLMGTNPFSRFEFDPTATRLMISCVGAFGVLDGGIEAIDPVNLVSLGFVISESTMGGEASDVVWRGPDRSFAIINDVAFNTSLIAWKPLDGSLLGSLYAPGGFVITDAALNDRDELWVGNNGFSAPGLFVFDASSGSLLAGPISTGLPPIKVTFDDATGTVLDAPSARPQFAMSAPWPNPASGVVRLSLSLEKPGSIDVAAFDVTGRRVRTLLSGDVPAGPRELRWELRDRRGRRLGAGTYWIRAASAGGVVTRRLVLLP